ncbi:MAG: hypothetical protein Q8O56_07770 [Solirubrobacteraceae bacterium]|nr:hypothetical protein [Solirubrobacteraceae bacterium]
MRRLAAVGIGLLVIVLLVFGINGCLNSRQEQALRDYNRDVSSVVQEANANVDAFYETLSGGGNSSTDVQSEINQLRFSAQRQSRQAADFDVPGDMRPAHTNLLLSLSLLQEAIGKVAMKIPAALSTDSATAVPAVRAIAAEMQAFDAANVVYNRRSAALIKQVLDEKGIGGQVVQNSDYLQNLGWLQPSTVARRINSQAGRGAGDGAASEPPPGLHGHALLAVAVGDLTLTSGQANRIPAGSNVAFGVRIANQGDHPATDVRVRVRITGSGDPITVQQVVEQTAAKTEATVTVRLTQAPPIGQPVTITAEVLEVPGERNLDNNRQTYPALFVRG